MDTSAITVRKRLHTFIDALPDYSLPAVEPLLSHLADWAPIIETDLTDEEHQLIAESVERYHSDPSSFVPLESLHRDRATR
jgi:hypothetical protein